MINSELKNCPICKRCFEVRINRKSGKRVGGIGRWVRQRNATTCSPKCSRIYRDLKHFNGRIYGKEIVYAMQ